MDIIRKFVGYTLLLCFSNSGFAQAGMYSLAGIPDTLKSNASVIVNVEDIDLKVESFEKATLRVHKIFTVLNEEGKGELLFNKYSSKVISLEEAEIKVYDV